MNATEHTQRDAERLQAIAALADDIRARARELDERAQFPAETFAQYSTATHSARPMPNRARHLYGQTYRSMRTNGLRIGDPLKTRYDIRY